MIIEEQWLFPIRERAISTQIVRYTYVFCPETSQITCEILQKGDEQYRSHCGISDNRVRDRKRTVQDQPTTMASIFPLPFPQGSDILNCGGTSGQREPCSGPDSSFA